MESNDKLLIHDKCGLPVELCVCPDAPVKYDHSLDRFVEQPPAAKSDAANTANNSAMDAIATITRAVSDDRLTDYTKVLMVKDALKWWQQHQ